MRILLAVVTSAVTLSGLCVLSVADAKPSSRYYTPPIPVVISPPRPVVTTSAGTIVVGAYLPTVTFDADIDASVDVGIDTPVYTAPAATTGSVSGAVSGSVSGSASGSATTNYVQTQSTQVQTGYATTASFGGELTSNTPLTTVHWEGGLALAIPMELSADANMHAIFGLQVDAVRIAAEYSMNKAYSETMDPTSTWRTLCQKGQNQRIGIAGRYRLDLGANEFGVGFYGEAGLGLNLTNWATQANTRTGDVMLGLGGEFMVGEHKRMGMDFGFRFMISEGATADAPRELSTIFTMGMLVGK